MSKNKKPDTNDSNNLRQEFDPEAATGLEDALFTADELDIYVNKVTLEAYIFHGKTISYDRIDHLAYDVDAHTVTVMYKDGSKQDLGVKVQWLLRPHFVKIEDINIVQTKDGDSIDGIVVPVKHTESPKT